MLANYAKWYSFTPPQRPNFPPPLTGTTELIAIAVCYALSSLRGRLPLAQCTLFFDGIVMNRPKRLVQE